MTGKKKRWIHKITAVLLAVALAAGPGTSSAVAESSVQAVKETAASSDWMADVDGDLPLSAISIPGTHDSCTKNVALSYIFRCQDTDIATQLQDGYRYLDLRLVLDEGDDGNALVIKHNFATCRKGASWFSDPIYLEDVLADVYAFLEEHPTETVILCMKAENGDDNISVLQDLLYQQIEAAQDLWYLKNEIPDLDEVRGKIVLATRFEDALEMGDSRRGLNFGWIDQGDREIVDIPYVLSMINDTQVLWVQDRYNYNISDKLDAIYDDLENCQADENTFSLNFTSTSGSGKVGHPKRYADAINEELLSYDWQQGTCYGIVVVDFATEDLARCIFETN